MPKRIAGLYQQMIDVIPLSNFDLDSFYARQSNSVKAKLAYGGCYSRNELKTLPLARSDLDKLCYWIFNLDDKNSAGTHWVMLLRTPHAGSGVKWEYFDSYGMPPPEEILDLLAGIADEIEYNSYQLQAMGTAYCGYYCLYVLERIMSSIRYAAIARHAPAPVWTLCDIMYEFGMNKRANDLKIHSWIMNQ